METHKTKLFTVNLHVSFGDFFYVQRVLASSPYIVHPKSPIVVYMYGFFYSEISGRKDGQANEYLMKKMWLTYIAIA